MKPYFRDDAVTIYHGDCRDILPTLEPVDLVLTDPPYGVRDEMWDAMDDYEFARFSMHWIAQARELSDSLVVFFTGYGSIRKICEMIYPRVRQMIWYKPPGSQYAGSAEARLWFAHETILHAYNQTDWVRPKTLAVANEIKRARELASLSRGAVDMVIRGTKTGLCYRWEEADCLPSSEQVAKLKTIIGLGTTFDEALVLALADKKVGDGADKGDVFEHRTLVGSDHPCAKPLGLMQDLLLTAGRDAQTVLDPFMGSGTTLRAAKNLRRKAIGIEIVERYCEIAAKRMSQSVMEL